MMEANRYWFIAVVTPNTEKACKEKLDKLIEVLNKDRHEDEAENEDRTVKAYVPIQRELHEWPSTGKRVWVDRVLCPCYLIIRCSNEERYQLACKAKFILHFWMDRSRKDKAGRADFARIPNTQMVTFMRMVGDAETPVTIDTSRLLIGSKVRIKSGRMEGLEGYVHRKPNGSTMLALRINMLGYALMECPIALLEEVKE